MSGNIIPDWKGICYHHSATRDGATLNWRGITRYHMNPAQRGVTITMDEYLKKKAAGERGLKGPWRANGYHFGIEEVAGEVKLLLGRPLTMEGAHTRGLNRTHIGVCIVGNFDRELPSPEKLELATRLAIGMGELFSFDIDGVTMHNKHSRKSCPGKLFPQSSFIRRLRHLWL